MMMRRRTSRNRLTSYVKIATGTVLALGLLLFILGRTAALRQGPEITLITPVAGEMVYKPLATVRGNTKRTTELTLNGQPIFIDEAGTFNEPLALNSGYNVLTLEAHDRFGKTTVIQQEIARLQPGEPPSETNPEDLEDNL